MWRVLIVSGVLGASLFLSSRQTADPSPTLPRLVVRNGQLMAGGQVIRLRGINWGWWQLGGTVYREYEMRRVANWGANHIRLAFDAAWLTHADHPDRWNEEGFRRIDEVLRWARRYKLYVILDMHVAPGGQNPTPYTVGGANRIWTDVSAQRQFARVWKEIARRFKGRPEVAAYELMNEPETKGLAPKGALRKVLLMGWRAVRSEDSQTVVVSTGDSFSSMNGLTDEIMLPDLNVFYTFHFYEPGRLTWQAPVPGCGYPDVVLTDMKWLRNTSEGPGISGTSDWQRLEHTFTASDDAVEAQVLLRSTANKGVAWFDDVQVQGSDGTVLMSADFRDGPGSFSKERPPLESMSWDGDTGHAGPGSLRVENTPEHTGWVGPLFRVVPGKVYKVTASVRLVNATGDTYLSAALMGGQLERVDRAWIRKRVQPAASFAKRYRVPVWVGEFGCAACALPKSSQARWVRDCIDVFEEAGFHWTYWNFRETTGPHSMALAPHSPSGEEWLNLLLLQELRRGWQRNKRANR